MAKKEEMKEELERKKAKEEPEKDEVEKAEEKPEDKVDKAVEEIEDEDEEEEDEDGKKKKKAKKGVGSSLNPEESEGKASSGESTLSPGASVPSKPQNVIVPPSDVDGKRTQETPMGKSVEPDLMKSPLYMGISKQIEEMRTALDSKFEAVYKSYNDRLDNMTKELQKAEKAMQEFYSKSFQKAYGENVSPESTQLLSIEKQIEMGKVRFSN